MSYISDRLGIDSGDSVLLLNAPRGYLGEIAPIPEDVTVTADPTHRPFDVVQAFVRGQEDIGTVIESANRAAADSRYLWVTQRTDDGGQPTEFQPEEVEKRLAQNGWNRTLSFTIDMRWRAIRFSPE